MTRRACYTMKALCPYCKQLITVITGNVFRAHSPGGLHCSGSGQAVRTLTVPYSDANTKSDKERAGGSDVKDSCTDESKPKVDEDLLVNCNQEEKPADSDKTSRKEKATINTQDEARDKKCNTNWYPSSGQTVPPPTDSAFDVITKSDEDEEPAGGSDVEGSCTDFDEQLDTADDSDSTIREEAAIVNETPKKTPEEAKAKKCSANSACSTKRCPCKASTPTQLCSANCTCACSESMCENRATARYKIRGNVSKEITKTLKSSDLKDAYTGRSMNDPQDMQMDHILEIQVFNAVLNTMKSTCSFTSREGNDVIKKLQEIANGVYNLNMTTQSINQVKKGPFTRFLNRLYGSDRAITLDQAIQESINDAAKKKKKGKPTCEQMRDDGTWGRIKTEVVKAYNDIDHQLEQLLDSDQTTSSRTNEIVTLFREELKKCVRAMGIMQ